MVLVKSNLYHLIIKSEHVNRYSIETNPKVTSDNEFEQILKFLSEFQPNLIGVNAGFYLKGTWKHQTTHDVMLLSGEQVEISITSKKQESNEIEFLSGVLNKIMLNTKFLMCKLFNSCYNPFQQRKTQTGSEIPGFKLSLYSEGQKGIYIVPQILVVDGNNESLNQMVLMNAETGKFYNKSDVVKVDKERDVLTFRDKSEIKKKSLRNVIVKPMVGYELASSLQKNWKRIHLTSSDLLKYWDISISQKPQQMTIAFIDPGFITMKGIDKSLNNMIFPVTQSAYNEYYRSNFVDVPYQQFPALEVYVCYQGDNTKAVLLIEAIESIRDKMQLSIVVYKAPEWNVQSFIPRPNVLYLIVCNPASLLYRKQTRQSLINSQVIFDLVDVKDIDKSNQTLNQVTALQHLSIICSKFRKAPWKLKNIPFCNQPLSVISLSIESSKTQLLSVSMCFSINSLLSKFISRIENVKESDLCQAIPKMIQDCLLRFQQFHKRFPNRMIMFLPANQYLPPNSYDQLRTRLSSFYTMQNKGALQLIIATHQPSPSLRIYKMMNNFINRQSITQPGILACLVFQNKLSIQLEIGNAMFEFIVDHSSNDPQFMKKMSQLIVKLAFGGVDNRFGGGLGFIGYAGKLNRWRDVEVEKWRGMLWEGHMLYL